MKIARYFHWSVRLRDNPSLLSGNEEPVVPTEMPLPVVTTLPVVDTIGAGICKEVVLLYDKHVPTSPDCENGLIPVTN
jgi:hypothetical protein